MSGHLLVIALGPVQDFIAAARRTRDLWCGSLLLSEVSKAVAKAVSAMPGVTLIFPASENPDEDLAPLPLDQLDANPELASESLNVANIILAELKAGLDPPGIKSIADTVKEAADDRWKDFAKRAREAGDSVIVSERWEAQVKEVIECYFAWVPFSDADYPQQRRRLMQLLAGRKALRDFGPWRGEHGVPKSSLDGARETILRRPENLNQALTQNDDLAQRLRLNGKEQLDAIGFTKRTATKTAFASVVRVAIDPWLRGMEQVSAARSALIKISNLCKQDVEDTGYFAAGSGAHYRDTLFRYDGRIFFDEQREGLKNALDKCKVEAGFADTLVSSRAAKIHTQIQTRLDNIGQSIKTIRDSLKKAGKPLEPLPYYAMLLADGDRMGETLEQFKQPPAHRAFTKALTEFTRKAKEIMNEKHHGCLVYSGGDDVLAFVPLDTCLPCARALHDEFGRLLREALDKLGLQAVVTPTLSVGIAVGHCMEALEDMLAFARAAEKDAKQPDRNGLAVHLYPRGGDALRVRAKWRDKPEESLDGRLMDWAQLHQANRIPDGFAYDLKDLVRDYDQWHDPEVVREALTKDALRLLSRKGRGPGEEGISKVKDLLAREFQEAADAEAVRASARRVADEVILARRVAEALRQATPTKNTVPEGEE